MYCIQSQDLFKSDFTSYPSNKSEEFPQIHRGDFLWGISEEFLESFPVTDSSEILEKFPRSGPQD